jgi:hypothetical protein
MPAFLMDFYDYAPAATEVHDQVTQAAVKPKTRLVARPVIDPKATSARSRKRG